MLRNDECNKNTEEVNHHLKDMSKTALTDYIDNSSFNPKKNLNNSKSHVNEQKRGLINLRFS